MPRRRNSDESLWAKALWLLIPVGLLAFSVLVLPGAGQGRPVRFALAAAPFFSLAAYIIAGVMNGLARRRAGNLDALRVCCWTAFGFGLGIGACPGGGYFGAYYPQHVPWALLVGAVIVIASVTLNVVLTLKFRPPPDDGAPYCQECGYNLTGNESGICPECGEPVKDQRRKDLPLF
jgi:predicted MFS family arabinose efflux permease